MKQEFNFEWLQTKVRFEAFDAPLPKPIKLKGETYSRKLRRQVEDINFKVSQWWEQSKF